MTLSGKPKVTHVIFDLDGTLIDSERIYYQIYVDIMAKIGKVYTDETFKAMTGRRRKAAMQIFHDKMSLDGLMTIPQLNAAIDSLLPSRLPDSMPMPGALRLVRHLAAHHIPMAICSGSQKMECDLKLMNLKELSELIPLVITGDDPDIHHGKPAPDPFLVTMERFKNKPASPDNVLVVEDSPNGVRSGIAAGMHVFMLCDPRYSEFEPPKELVDQIDRVIHSFDDIKPEEVGLPPYS